MHPGRGVLLETLWFVRQTTRMLLEGVRRLGYGLIWTAIVLIVTPGMFQLWYGTSPYGRMFWNWLQTAYRGNGVPWLTVANFGFGFVIWLNYVLVLLVTPADKGLLASAINGMGTVPIRIAGSVYGLLLRRFVLTLRDAPDPKADIVQSPPKLEWPAANERQPKMSASGARENNGDASSSSVTADREAPMVGHLAQFAGEQGANGPSAATTPTMASDPISGSELRIAAGRSQAGLASLTGLEVKREEFGHGAIKPDEKASLNLIAGWAAYLVQLAALAPDGQDKMVLLDETGLARESAPRLGEFLLGLVPPVDIPQIVARAEAVEEATKNFRKGRLLQCLEMERRLLPELANALVWNLVEKMTEPGWASAFVAGMREQPIRPISVGPSNGAGASARETWIASFLEEAAKAFQVVARSSDEPILGLQAGDGTVIGVKILDLLAIEFKLSQGTMMSGAGPGGGRKFINLKSECQDVVRTLEGRKTKAIVMAIVNGSIEMYEVQPGDLVEAFDLLARASGGQFSLAAVRPAHGRIAGSRTETIAKEVFMESWDQVHDVIRQLRDRYSLIILKDVREESSDSN